jgi:carbon storage regulator
MIRRDVWQEQARLKESQPGEGAMGHLILTRRVGERIHFSIAPDADRAELLLELSTSGIWLEILEQVGSHTRIGIMAPHGLTILRAELLGRDAGAV